MNQEVKQKWLEALRSGRYQQGKEFLAKDNKFCCLGVLCELAVSAGVITAYQFDESTRSYGDGMERAIKTLPDKVQEWADLSSPNPIISYRGLISLAGLNDTGEAFETIANIIEQKL